jgi:hypothetical protein
MPDSNINGMVTQEIIKFRGRLGSKSLRGNRFYKGHRAIAEKASHYFKKASQSLKKPQFPWKSFQK